MIKVTVWNEFRNEREEAEVAAVYPDGIHAAIAGFLGAHADMEIKTATFDMPEHGLTQEVLDNTDVLLWWAHDLHGAVSQEIADRVCERVLCGMGIIFLHSAHMARPFVKLMGTSGSLKWRDVGEHERLHVVAPSHPIAAGVPAQIFIPHEEMYGEQFDIPKPDDLVFIGWYQGGEVFRSGCCWNRGRGKVFYFQPGHESYPVYYQPEIQTIITNAVRWACPSPQLDRSAQKCRKVEPLENF